MRKAAWALIVLLVVGAPAAAFKRTAVGEPVKDFTLQRLDGQPLHLREVLGDRATLVVFWAVWSPRSAEALADFQELYEKYAAEGLQVIGVNVEHQEWEPGAEGEIQAFLDALGITFPVVVDRTLEVFNAYGVIAVPSIVLADGSGRIVALLEGYAYTTRFDFRDRVLELLGVLKRRVAEVKARPAYRPRGKAERYARMGAILLEREMPQRAVPAFRRAIKEDPDYPEAHEGLARAYEMLGKADKAAREAALAAEARARLGEEPLPPPGPAGVGGGTRPCASGRAGAEAARFVRMGELFLKRGLARAAEDAFRKAIARDPGCAEPYAKLAEALEAQGRSEEALGARERAAGLRTLQAPPEPAPAEPRQGPSPGTSSPAGKTNPEEE